MSTAVASGAAALADAATLEWTYDPWQERPRIAALATASAVGLCALVVIAREPFVVALGLCLFCIAAFAPALTRVECRLEEQGPARRGLLGWERRRWADIRRIEPLPAGALLSPFAKRHWLDATRALTLPMPAARCAALRAELVARWEARRGA